MTETLVRADVDEGAKFDLAASLYDSPPRQPGLGILSALLRALYESRRRQAERDMRRHKCLLDRYAARPRPTF